MLLKCQNALIRFHSILWHFCHQLKKRKVFTLFFTVYGNNVNSTYSKYHNTVHNIKLFNTAHHLELMMKEIQ